MTHAPRALLLAGVLSVLAAATSAGWQKGGFAATLSGPPGDTLTETTDRSGDIAFRFLDPEPRNVGGRAPTNALIAELVAWVSTNFELPASEEHPRVEFASAMNLAAMRYGGLIARRQADSTELDPSTTLNLARDLVAVYHDARRIIFLPEGWTGESPAELSVLVHEMVHHLQNVGAVKYECAAAREKPAYLAQNRWLQQFGQDLETTFEVDLFTVVVKSTCMLN